VEYFSARVIDRSQWGTIWEDKPRFLGMALTLWGFFSVVWQPWLSFRARRAWIYSAVSSAGLAVASLLGVALNATRHPDLLLALGAVGVVCLLVLLFFSDEFAVDVVG
jgi:hypothetical protein